MVVAFSLCTKCGSQTQTDDRFCQDCGTVVERSTRNELHSSLRSSPNQVKPITKKHWFTMPGSTPGQPAVLLPILASTIGLFALIPICMYAIDNSYKDISVKYLNDKALEAIEIGHTTEAVEIMTREQIEHTTLRRDQLDVLDKAFYKRSAQFMESNNYTSALADLYRITPAFPKKLVEQRIAECNSHLPDGGKHIQPQSRTAPAPAKDGSNAVNTNGLVAPGAAPIAPAQLQNPVPSLVPSVSADQQKSISQKLISTLKQRHLLPERKRISTDSRSSNNVDTNSTASNTTASAGSPSHTTAPGSVGETPANASTSGSDQDFVPTDVVKYNELLATYFSHNQKTRSEPPTFKEWVRAGRGNF